MKLSAFAATLAAVAVLVTAGSPSAYAETKPKTIKEASKTQVSITVSEGDNLSMIATNHQTTYQRLYDANTQINDPDLIYPGDKIRIPDVSEQIAHRDLPVEDIAAADAQVQSLRDQTAQSAPIDKTPVVSAPTAQAAPLSVSGCGDNSYANYIYMHESGCNTASSSANGCFGIGQACPASKLTYCGTDYACQNAFFTSYASKYGGWAGAYNFWTSHGWW
jgi:LysM repeat protein